LTDIEALMIEQEIPGGFDVDDYTLRLLSKLPGVQHTEVSILCNILSHCLLLRYQREIKDPWIICF
jgi:hypothetical protein